MMKKYSNKKLQYLADNEIIYPKKYAHYEKIKNELFDKYSLPRRKSTEEDEDFAFDEVVPEELFWDVCEIVNDLADILLEEKQKRGKFIENMKDDLKSYLYSLNNKHFEEM